MNGNMTDDTKNITFSESELGLFENARVGTYYILPLRANVRAVTDFSLESYAKMFEKNGWEQYEWDYDDLYEHINDLFSKPTDSGTRNKIGINYSLTVDRAMEFFSCQIGKDIDCGQIFYVDGENGEKMMFRFRCVQIVLMHTGIGFFILGIESDTPQTYDLILNSGHNDSRMELGLADDPNVSVSLGSFIEKLLKSVDMTDYARYIDKGQYDRILRDTVPYTVAIVPGYVYGGCSDEIKEKIRHICLNIRHGQRIGSANDYSNSDEAYYCKYASTSTKNGKITVRWGLYTLFEMTTQVIFCDTSDKDSADPINVYSENREDNYLPFMIITLYERYSYLFFSEIFKRNDISAKKVNIWAEEQMIVLKALGNVMPCDMTPYSNENSFLSAQRELYEIPETLKLIDDKLNMINHIQEEKSENKKRHMEFIIAAFGIFSILCDTLGVVSYLFQNIVTPFILWGTFLGEVFIIAALSLILNIRKK